MIAIYLFTEYTKLREEVLRFWEHGDPDAEWHEIKDEHREAYIPNNLEPLPAGTQKNPHLIRPYPR